MSHQQLYPDALTGRPSPGGTGFNVYRDGHVVFAGTLGRESLARVLAFLETTCEPAEPPECQHRWFFAAAALPHVSCSRCGEKYPQPEPPKCEPEPCEHCYCKRTPYCDSSYILSCCHCGQYKPT